jgi:protein-L-isoaspartate(D-aspartate) O-methyltransferase
VPPAWLEQTGPNGRIVVPMRLRGSVTRSVAFERENGHWRSRSSEMCGFMPLRGLADDARRVIDLAPDGTVALHVHQEQTMDPTALAGVLEQPRYESWTGVQFGGQESFEWLWLWLTCTMGNALSRMIVQPEAKDRGLVTSGTGLHIMATAEEGTLAYLTLRPAENTAAEARRWEVGVIGHGKRGENLADRVADEIRAWNGEYRSHEAQFSLRPTDAWNPITGQFAFQMPRNLLLISWR